MSDSPKPMTMWCASDFRWGAGELRQLEVAGQTEKMVLLKNGRRTPKESSHYMWFASEQKGREWLRKYHSNNVRSCENHLAEARARLEKWL